MISWEEFASSLDGGIFDIDKIKSAFEWMTDLHKDQLRKYEVELYAIHPIRVALNCVKLGEEMIIAGLLHDTLEKTSATLSEISINFGDRVSELVLGVSKIRGRSMVEALDVVVTAEPSSISLRVADRIDNLSFKYSFLSDNRKQDYLEENEQIIRYMVKYSQYDLLGSFLKISEEVGIPMKIIKQNNQNKMVYMEFDTFFALLPSGLDKDMLREGYIYARQQHDGQFRKFSGLPYFVHPVGVALKLKHTDTEIIISALLHDVVEDTETTHEDIRKLFGVRISKLVYGMTKTEERGILETLEEIIPEYPEVIIIKLADRLDNMQDNFEKLGKKSQTRYLKETPQIIKIAERSGIDDFIPDLQVILSKFQ